MASKLLEIETLTSEELARLAGLRYVTDAEAGILRQVNGTGFSYLNGHGLKLRDRQKLKRIETLAIPPAWTEVWICRQAEGHLQVTGRDDRGRKQYIYHERWREMSNLAKFWRLRHSIRFLPVLRKQVQRDLRRRGLPRERVLAGMIALLDLTLIRIGNEEYVRQNNSYGVATLRTRHVKIEGRQARLSFRGKSGLHRESTIEDKQLVRLLKELKKLPGALVFQYLDDEGKAHRADANMVNEYLRELSPHALTAKDFRTWKASALAAAMLYEKQEPETEVGRKRVVNKVLRAVAEQLGNTPTVCRKYYVHAGLVEAYMEGEFQSLMARFKPTRRKSVTPGEQVLARFLQHWPADV